MGPVIEIKNLTKSFGDKKILNGINLDIHKGEIMYIIGKSGAGKSVLLKHICALMMPDSGSIYIEGNDIFSISKKELEKIRKKVGVLFQMAALFDSMTVFENVAFSLRRFTKKSNEEIKTIVSEKLALVGLKSVEDKAPSSLSGGMQKRVGLARAIALDPEIVLYDEPTTGVDPILASAVDDLILTLSRELKVTTLVISHDMNSTFKVASKAAMLYDGKFILTGEPEEFKECKDPIVNQFIRGEAKGPIPIL
ncbi:MAG: ABC transporter ATP-binding protein [Spirochaetia bacterium]|nr:ABC transporter ATP-binding protein [Spirochaetia bacterium]